MYLLGPYWAGNHNQTHWEPSGSKASLRSSLELCFFFSGEDYTNLVGKREIIRNDFHDKMVDTSKVQINYNYSNPTTLFISHNQPVILLMVYHSIDFIVYERYFDHY